MAFDFNFLASTGSAPPAPAFFTYKTTDSRDDILLVGYFNKAIGTIKIGDHVMCDSLDAVVTVRLESIVNGSLTTTEVFTSRRNTTTSMVSPSVIEVFEPNDLDKLAENGVIAFKEPTAIIIKVVNVRIVSRFFLDDSGPERPVVQLNADGGAFALEYIGPENETFITGANGDFFTMDVGLVGRANNSRLLNTEDGVINFMGGTIRLWADLGIHQRGSFNTGENTRFAAWGAGFKLKNCRAINLLQPESLFDTAGSILFDIESNLTDGRIVSVLGAPGFLDPTSSLLRINPSLRDDDRVSVIGVTLTSGNLFNTDGTDGTFTAVTDAAVSSTTINTVSDVDGLAQFNFTVGPTLFVGQQVIVVGFVTNTNYNRTITITAVGAGFFRSDSIKIGSDESGGSFTSNSVTLTDTSTTLNDGDTVNIDTNLSTDYDGGSIIYNQQTNSFEISRAFTSTKEGGWSTRGLDQTNPKVAAAANTNFEPSQAIASAFINSSVAVTTISNGVYLPINTGGLTESAEIERYKLIDPVLGVFKFTGNESGSQRPVAQIWALKTSGSTQNYRFTVSINGATPVFATTPFAPMEVKSTKVHIVLGAPILLSKSDTFQLMVAGDGTADNLVITDLFISN